MWIIDFESSGLSKKSYPIEVGLTNGYESVAYLIKPMEHWLHWDLSAQEVHGIKKSELIHSGCKSKDVAESLNVMLRNSTVYCDSINWDGFWLNVLFSDNGISPLFKLCDIQDILKDDEQIGTYLDVKNRLLRSGEYQEHRALDDARLIYNSLVPVFSVS